MAAEAVAAVEGGEAAASEEAAAAAASDSLGLGIGLPTVPIPDPMAIAADPLGSTLAGADYLTGTTAAATGAVLGGVYGVFSGVANAATTGDPYAVYTGVLAGSSDGANAVSSYVPKSADAAKSLPSLTGPPRAEEAAAAEAQSGGESG